MSYWTSVNNKSELYELVKDKYENINFFALVKQNSKIEPLHFYEPLDGWLLEAPCTYMDMGSVSEHNSDFSDYDYFVGIEYKGRLYEVDCPQVSPFLEGEFEFKIISEEEALKIMIDKDNGWEFVDPDEVVEIRNKVPMWGVLRSEN